MGAYEDYRKRAEEYVKDQLPLIKEICEESTPQHILWKKEVASAIEKELGGEYTVREVIGGFFFKELLVNKLMHFAYLHGAKAIDHTSYEKGWEDCRHSMLTKFREWHEDSVVG